MGTHMLEVRSSGADGLAAKVDHDDEDAQQQGSGDAAELFLGVLRAGAAADWFWRSWHLGIATRVVILDECALHLREEHA